MIEVGYSAAFQHRYSQDDFDRFAKLSGDDNPIHVDPNFAAGTQFKRTVCHGMLLYSSICAVVSSLFSDMGTYHLEQELMFTAPTFAEEPITFNITVQELLDGQEKIRLSTDVIQSDGNYSCRGQSKVAISAKYPQMKGTNISVDDGPESPELKGLTLGQRASVERIFSESDLAEYQAITGDNNPLHYDDALAIRLGLQYQIIPGGLLGGMFSHLLGTVLPGRGTMWLKQTLQFNGPAYVGEMLRSSVEIIRIRPEKELVDLRTIILDSAGRLICSGQALVLVRALETDII